MFLFEKFSNSLAGRISSALNLDKDQEEVLAYGAFAVIHTVWSTFLVLIFGIVFDILLQAAIILCTAAILKKYSGGAHSTSPNRCAVMGVIIFGSLAMAVDKLDIYFSMIAVFVYAVLSFIFAYYIIYRYCPVDSPNKPIKKEETRRRLRKGAIRVAHILLGITIVLFIFYYEIDSANLLNIILSICTGLMWQAFMLTSPGNFLVATLDDFLRKITILIGGKGV
jgi:accessory gene regulator B